MFVEPESVKREAITSLSLSNKKYYQPNIVISLCYHGTNHNAMPLILKWTPQCSFTIDVTLNLMYKDD